MLDDPTPPHHPDDAPPDPARHPGFGELCLRCGTASRAGDHWGLCREMRERPGLWADGWVDLAAFGLDERSAVGWPEVRTGPVAGVMHGGLGPESMFATTGSWVRHPDAAVPTWRRVAAARVLVAADVDPADAVAKVVAARPIAMALVTAPPTWLWSTEPLT